MNIRRISSPTTYCAFMTTTQLRPSDRLRAESDAINTLYRAFNEKNPDLVDSVLAADWEDIPMAPGQPAGPEGIKAIIRMLGEALPDINITVHDMVQESGKIAVRAAITGTHEGTLFGIAATGKRVHVSMQEFHTFKDGLVAVTWHIEDWFGMFQQMGQSPPKG